MLLVFTSLLRLITTSLTLATEEIGLPPLWEWSRYGNTLVFTEINKNKYDNFVNKIQAGVFLRLPPIITSIEIWTPISLIDENAFDGLQALQKLCIHGKNQTNSILVLSL